MYCDLAEHELNTKKSATSVAYAPKECVLKAGKGRFMWVRSSPRMRTMCVHPHLAANIYLSGLCSVMCTGHTMPRPMEQIIY